MSGSQFPSFVREAAALESEEDAERVAEATLAELGRNLSPGEADDLAARLPPEYGAVMDPEDVPVAETFVGAVEAESTLDGTEAAETAEATLSALGERLTREEAEDVAAYLHGDADEWLVEEGSGDAEDVPLDEFVERVAVRAEVSEDRAREYVAEVTDVLGDVAPNRELDRAVDQLPGEYGGLVAFA